MDAHPFAFLHCLTTTSFRFCSNFVLFFGNRVDDFLNALLEHRVLLSLLVQFLGFVAVEHYLIRAHRLIRVRQFGHFEDWCVSIQEVKLLLKGVQLVLATFLSTLPSVFTELRKVQILLCFFIVYRRRSILSVWAAGLTFQVFATDARVTDYVSQIGILGHKGVVLLA